VLDATATVTAKGQVTIPAEMRRALGIRPHDRLRLEITDGRLTLRREAEGISRFKGSVKSLPFSGTMQELIEAERAAFEQGVAEEVIESMRREAEGR
jgi:antitoxin PrlF